MFDVNPLITKAHAASRAAGWWTDLQTGNPINPRRVAAEKIALAHSEVSEAAEAYWTDSMDDTLPHRLGLGVEVADAAMRLADLIGALYPDRAFPVERIPRCGDSIVEQLMFVNVSISNALELLRKGQDAGHALLAALRATLSVNYSPLGNGPVLDIIGAIDEKMAFNARRADHKPESRLAAGGKAF